MNTKIVKIIASDAITNISAEFCGCNISGQPTFDIIVAKTSFPLPVNDIDDMIEMLQGIKQEVSPFLCRETFEAKKPDLLKKYGVDWVSCFEQYHFANRNDD